MADISRKDNLADVREIVTIQLKRKQPTHTEVVNKVRSELEVVLPDYTQEELSDIVSDIEYNIRITTQEPDILVDTSTTSNWFHLAEVNTKTHYFNRYINYLRSQGFPEQVLMQMEKDTKRILSLSANPLAKKDGKRGLVVGDVQSGKTANYLSLINLACDFGYKIIVLLAGMTDSLREQTQDRVDLGFIGAVSESIGGGVEYAGVGLMKNDLFAVPLTNTKNDFVKFIKSNINATPSEFTKPLVLVVKKNKDVLTHVCKWLKSKKISNQNVLIIDDEADNASVNSRRDENNPTQINKKIRELYCDFDVATYVGFTATPFANIFINPLDEHELQSLFPQDFIVQLKTPSNYCGSHWFFDHENVNPHLRVLDENEEGFLPAVHRRDAEFNGPSESMKEAIYAFLLGCAVRTLRGQEGKHRTMMINISRFNPVQWRILAAVKDYVDEMSAVVREEAYKDLAEYLKHPLLKKIHEVYSTLPIFEKARQEFTFDSVRMALRVEAGLLKTVVFNNEVPQDRRFSYKNCPNGARVIAIGGFLLSRGLTLEGLMISYYSRNTSTYDSLLQMGRWFGYRPKYDDLCCLYISRINIQCFKAVVAAVDDLKDQFAEMQAKCKAPKDFGLMVKQSPDTLETALLVTSRNKMIHSQTVTYWISYGGTVADTSKLHKSIDVSRRNEQLCQSLVDGLAVNGLRFEKFGNRSVIRGVGKKEIAEFIAKLDIHYENRKFDTDTLSTYISESRLFPTWDITVATGSSEKIKWTIGGETFSAAVRECEMRTQEDFIRVGLGNNRLIEPGIFSAGLDDDQLDALKALKKKNLTYADFMNVENRRPLLVFYPLDLETEGVHLSDAEPRIGFAVGFPSRGREERAQYRANEIKLRQIAENFDIMDEAEEKEKADEEL